MLARTKRQAHFIVRDKAADGSHRYYLYKESKAGQTSPDCQLLMMARFFPQSNEIRIYNDNDLGNLLNRSSTDQKQTLIPFDYDNGHFAKVCLHNKGASAKEFVVKARHCQSCSSSDSYFCQGDKSWAFEQELGSYKISREIFYEGKKNHIYTSAYLQLPQVEKNGRQACWCPR